MKSLYRKYRPLKLEDVVGQEQVTKPLISSLGAGKINHAYLFIGPRGCGKTSVARILAHQINGFKYELEDNYVDIIEIDGASNRGIDNIRELREKVAITPTQGKYKVYIIDEVHMLTKEAFNALLKTLEEPPEHAVFIMATTDAYKIPVTIISRAQTYTFKLADAKTMLQFLKLVAENEKIKISNETLEIIVKKGEGSFRDSLSLLDQISTLSNEEITKEMVISAMGLPEDEKIEGLLSGYVARDVVKITTVLKDLLSSGVKAETLTEEIISKIIENPKSELLTLLSKLPEVKAPYAEAKLLVALAFDETIISDGPPRARSFSQRFTQSSPRSSRQLARPEVSLGDFTRLGRGKVDKNDTGSGGKLSEMAVSSKATPTDETSENKDFDWDGFLDNVRGKNEAIYSQLIKTKHKMVGNELHIYPMKKIIKSILARDNNRRILVETAEGVKITIHEADETPVEKNKDETLSRISDIMGGEVINDGGGSPF